MKIHRFNLSSLLLLGLILFSCNSDKKENTLAGETELKSGILIENMDTKIIAGNDFHAYVNGGWMSKTEIPDDKGSYGAGYMVHEQSEKDVKAIIEESAAGDFDKGSPEQKVGDLYSSFMDTLTRNELGIAPLQSDLKKIEGISNYDDLAIYFAYANKLGYTVPLQAFVYQDFKDPTKYTVYLYQGGLGLPEREYYLAKDARSKEIRKKYLEHIETMFSLAEMKNGKEAAKTIMALETRIAEKHMKKEDTRDLVKMYNMFEAEKLPEVMPDFNWNNYLTEVGIKDEKQIGVLTLEYTKALNGIITSTDLKTWKTYLKWSLLNSTSNRLTQKLDKQDFGFYTKELRGVPEQRPMWTRGVAVVNDGLGEVVGQVYVKKHFPPVAKERMETMVSNLIKAYEISIKDLDWMGEETKAEALDKLSKFNPKIGYPNKWKDYSNLTIDSKDYFGNRKRSSLSSHQRELDKLGKPIDKDEWQMTPQTVNAYYNPVMNEIVFPAAILQPPFFDMGAEDAVNYGSIGAVIGHEIGHGFDDTGSTFDGDGAMRNWWQDSDTEEFKKRTTALVEQYNKFEVLDSLYVNGEFTLGENIGDLGGLSIALKAYKLSLDGKEGPEMDGFTATQRVFLGYGQSWMNKMRDETVRVQVQTDPHSPPKFRVNGVVRNVPEFYEAFNVKAGDSLYIAPENRVKIW